MAGKWNDRNPDDTFDITPNVGTLVVVKYAPGEDREYKIIEVSTAAVQTQIVNDLTIVAWQYMSDLLNSDMGTNKNVLLGVKEGEDNDWAPTENGYLQLEYDVYMLRQQINARVQTLPNEVDNFDGVDYMNVIFSNTPVAQKAAALIDVIQTIPTVKSVTFISAAWVDKNAGIFKFVFHIQSAFGELDFNMGLDSQNKKLVSVENA